MLRNCRRPFAALVTLVTIVTLAALVAACGGDSTETTPPLAGSYNLVRVNGTPLPSVDTVDGQARTIVSGTLTVTDTMYGYTVCAAVTGAVAGACGAGKLAFTDTGLVWWSPSGASFVSGTSHASRGLVVAGDSLTFQRNDFATPTFTFAR